MELLLTFTIAFGITALLTPAVIPLLRKLKFGQSILQIGPSWHNAKSGTPTMGGLVFIVGTLVALLFRIKQVDNTMLFALLGALGFGAIGFLDDYIKVVSKRNLGLRAWQKMSLQILVSLGFLLGGMQAGVLTTVIDIPFSNLAVNLELWYLPLAMLVLLAVVNSVNLTDGIDGLATSITIVVLLFFAAIAGVFPALRLLCVASVGALFGFLLFNKCPAKVFMGDTGSLYLGGLVGTIALLVGDPLILIVVGFVYLCESLSVIIQVASFQLTGKRVFRMSPIHHHLEMSGWNENKIVAVSCGVTLVLCVISYYF